MTTKITKKTLAERRAEIAERMHVPKMSDGYHILEIPGRNGEPYEFWPGPYKTERGARLFLDHLLDWYAEADPAQALEIVICCKNYDEEAGVLTFLEGQKNISDRRALARDLCRLRPWRSYLAEDDLPF